PRCVRPGVVGHAPASERGDVRLDTPGKTVDLSSVEGASGNGPYRTQWSKPDVPGAPGFQGLDLEGLGAGAGSPPGPAAHRDPGDRRVQRVGRVPEYAGALLLGGHAGAAGVFDCDGDRAGGAAG